MDAMVDSHYQFGTKKVAMALESDNLKTLTGFLAGMGCEIQAALVRHPYPRAGRPALRECLCR